MCDCYEQKCINCGNVVQVHVADFCTERENVVVACNECVDQGYEFDIHSGGKEWACLPREIEMEQQVFRYLPGGDTVDVGVVGSTVYFYCCDDSAYGIDLN